MCSFSTLGVQDSWTYNNFPRHLHITEQLKSNIHRSIRSIVNMHFYVDFTITTFGTKTEYTSEQTGVYYPFIIHHNKDNTELIRIYWHDTDTTDKYNYKMNIFPQ